MKCIDCFNLKATLPIGDKGEFQWYSAKAQCNKKHFAFVSVARANGRFHEHQNDGKEITVLIFRVWRDNATRHP